MPRCTIGCVLSIALLSVAIARGAAVPAIQAAGTSAARREYYGAAARPAFFPEDLASHEPTRDRLGRNLDQIGGGNLLRSEPTGPARYPLPSRRNLDQIGGGNLLRDAEDRAGRNLARIGGGTSERDADAVPDERRDDFARAAGRNFLRSLGEIARRLEEADAEA